MLKFIKDEKGFTSVGIALALIISLSLIFTGAQVYRINSASAEVQEVADAASLAAENQVAEFSVIAQFCDAVILSLSLTALTTMGLGIAALCVPATASLSGELLNSAQKIIDTRNSFTNKAATSLNRLQSALPFLAAASAANVSKANSANIVGANYIGIAILVSSEGTKISVPSITDDETLLQDINNNADSIREQAQTAEAAAKEANESKERAFLHDCGDNPNYCMYERATKLAGLSGSDNPLYSSIDTWSFSVALERARSYYRARLANETPENSSVSAQAKSALRKRFYLYAQQQLRYAYVNETDDSFDAYFPILPKNTEQMRQSDLYTETVYPISLHSNTLVDNNNSEEGNDSDSYYVMHAWDGCPGASNIVSYGSIASMEANNYTTCESCEFKASSLGRVASASSSIENGFEYHYNIVAEEAEIYEKAIEAAAGPKTAVKNATSNFFSQLASLLKNITGTRITINPPGRYGAISFVVNTGSESSSGGFLSSFTTNGGSLGSRTAVSAATLVGDSSEEGKTSINSLLDSLKQNSGAAVGAAGIVLNLWSSLLGAYANGQSSLTTGIQNGLNKLPLVGASGLGTWASKKLTSTIKAIGLQPADTKSKKAVLVNTSYVAERDTSEFASSYLSLKQRVIKSASGVSDLYSMVLNDAEKQALSKLEGLSGSIHIASLELTSSGGVSIPITIPLPAQIKSFGVTGIQGFFEKLRALHSSLSGLKIWQ